MKHRLKVKKYNREVKSLLKTLKRDKDCSHERLFFSHEYYEGNFSWSDILFIGIVDGRKRLINATIMSSLDCFEDRLSDLVYESCGEFNGKKVDKYRKEILESKSIKFKPYIKYLPDYEFGAGLDIVTEEPVLNKDLVLDYVKKISIININSDYINEISISDNYISFNQKEIDEHTDFINSARQLIV